MQNPSLDSKVHKSRNENFFRRVIFAEVVKRFEDEGKEKGTQVVCDTIRGRKPVFIQTVFITWLLTLKWLNSTLIREKKEAGERNNFLPCQEHDLFLLYRHLAVEKIEKEEKGIEKVRGKRIRN